MSLRAKMMVSICVFMVLVLGLLTVNLWIDAAARARAEAQRTAELAAHMVADWLPPGGARTPEEWDRLAGRLGRSRLIAGWTVVGLASGEGRLRVLLSSDPEPSRVLRDGADLFARAFSESELRLDLASGAVFAPLGPHDGPERYVARLELRGVATPSYEIGDAMRGIATVMVLGTALLLLNAYVFTNRFVLRPLGTLVEASNRVAAGDFSKKIPEASTYDEMGRMIRAFNLMIDKIAEHNRGLQEDIRRARTRITATERRLFAAQRLSATGTLAAGIAHEINNPLGGMINAAQALRSGTLDEAKRAEYVDLILDGLERVRVIVRKVLQFRPGPFRPQPVRLREAVEQAVAFLQHRLRSKEVAVRNELPEDLPPVQADPVELQQAFLNILMNAVDACVMGEGEIVVSHRLAELQISVRIADNGCGMEEEELVRCMDPFFTTKDVGEGTGLGLSVAHTIVANHGGKMEIESRRGQGTAVTLTFPLDAARASREAVS